MSEAIIPNSSLSNGTEYPVPFNDLLPTIKEMFDVSKLLPYARTLEDLYIQINDIFNHLIRLESTKPDSFEKILKDITDKYIGYFNLNDDIVRELISESGYDYLIDVGLNLGTTELSVFYAYLKLFHFLKGTRQGLELVLDLLGYDAKLIEWWEQNYTGVLKRGGAKTFDVVIKRHDGLSLTFSQTNKIRKFTRFYVFPLLRYIIQDILLEFASIGILEGGYADKLFYAESVTGTILISNAGFYDYLYDSNILPVLQPNVISIIPFHYDNVEGYTQSLFVGDIYYQLILESVTTVGFIIQLDIASTNANISFTIYKNNISVLTNITLGIGQHFLDQLLILSLVKSDIISISVDSLDVLDTNVGNSFMFGIY